jgi:hypothetical protein
MEAWIKVGQMLLAEKEQMPHGEWGRWLHDNRDVLGFSERTAQRLMEVAQEAAANPSALTDLSFWRRSQISGRKRVEQGKADPKNKVSSDCAHNSNSVTPQESAAERKAQFLANAEASMQAARYEGPVDDDIVATARLERCLLGRAQG